MQNAYDNYSITHMKQLANYDSYIIRLVSSTNRKYSVQ